MIPVIQRPIIYDVRSQPRNIPVTTPSKDLQNVNITLRILFRPEVQALPWVFKVRANHLLQCCVLCTVCCVPCVVCCVPYTVCFVL